MFAAHYFAGHFFPQHFFPSGGGGASPTPGLYVNPRYVVNKPGFRRSLPQKDPLETIIVTFDYTLDLAEAETISAPAVIVADVLAGIDDTPSAILLGASQVSSPFATQSVIGGIVGVTYRLKCSVDTSNGQELVLAGKLPVRNS